MTVATVPCNLCGGTDVDVVGNTGRDGKPLRSVICRACGLVWTDPRPGPEVMKEFYAEKYRLQYKSAVRPRLKHACRETQRAIQRYERIKPLLIDGMKILDIGAGGGFFPYFLKQQGYNVNGIEPNQGYAAYAREDLHMDIKVGFVQDIDFDEGSFDIITLNHVLEHLEDPGAVLKRLFYWNKTGGFLNVEVPNIESTYHAPARRFHLAHLYTFNPDNLRLLGMKAGYSIHDLRLMPGTRHINMIFQKSATPVVKPVSFEVPGNYLRIKSVLDSHTPVHHYLSGKTYKRFFLKQFGYLKEKLTIRKFSGGREIADYLITRYTSN